MVCCCNCWSLKFRTVCLNTERAIGIWHSWLKHFNCWWEAVKYLICYSCIFNVQLHVHLKKWTLKFKLLYLRNYISYFNKICRICCVNTHIQSLKVWLKSVLSWLKYSFFSRGLFLLVHPVGTNDNKYNKQNTKKRYNGHTVHIKQLNWKKTFAITLYKLQNIEWNFIFQF